jgi:uncharacterized iron-regulated membrane protein
MKLFFRNIHLYLSLAAGLVIMIACVTGAILVFEKELQETFHPERYKVSDQGSQIDLSKLVQKAKEELPESELVSVKVYSEPTRTVEIYLSSPEKQERRVDNNSKAQGIEKSGRPTPIKATHIAYVNPYTASVIEVFSLKGAFFHIIIQVHRWLLGKNDGIGKYIMGVSTFIFMFIIVTGIILWWPRTRKILAQRTQVKWDGNWKRLNHDLHLVLGFYSSIFLFVFAFTAMTWSFQWFNKGIHKITNSSVVFSQPAVSVSDGKSPVTIDASVKTIKSAVKNAVYYLLQPPLDSSGVYTVYLLPKDRPEMKFDTYYLDQYSGTIKGGLKFSERNAGEKVRSYLKPIHTSSIFGLPSKILGFIVCLCGITFPITGLIMWINRLRAERKLAKRK